VIFPSLQRDPAPAGVCVLRMLKRRHQGGTAVVPKYLLSISPDI
jgi:hypothetical protein